MALKYSPKFPVKLGKIVPVQTQSCRKRIYCCNLGLGWALHYIQSATAIAMQKSNTYKLYTVPKNSTLLMGMYFLAEKFRIKDRQIPKHQVRRNQVFKDRDD